MQPSQIYKSSLSLLTDLYQLTMGMGYFKSGMADYEASFSMTFRKNPFGGNYAIFCGLEDILDWLENLKFDNDDIAFLETIKGNDDKPIFDSEYLNYLRNIKFSCEVHAMEEGTVAFPHEPLIRVTGPLIQVQLVETAILCILNFQTLIATKASRICQAADGDPVFEFGLRRAQGIDGGLSATRAAYIGGCSGTSNVLAGKLYGIPVKGTQAHSWVMAFDEELSAFKAYAKAVPNNCIFPVDTYNTHNGVLNAIKVGKELREAGHEMIGIRLDSGDLVKLSQQARKMLDEGGFLNAEVFPNAKVTASNDLDEYLIEDIKARGGKVNIWGVGTKLVTAFDQPALGGVYKLNAIRAPGEDWKYKVKLSEDIIKISDPGILQVVRLINEENKPYKDIIYNSNFHAEDVNVYKKPIVGENVTVGKRLLNCVMRDGQRTNDPVSIHKIREKVANELDWFRNIDYNQYSVVRDSCLNDLKQDIIRKNGTS